MESRMEDVDGLQLVEFSIDRGVWPVLRGQARSVGVLSKNTHRINPPLVAECPVLPQLQHRTTNLPFFIGTIHPGGDATVSQFPEVTSLVNEVTFSITYRILSGPL